MYLHHSLEFINTDAIKDETNLGAKSDIFRLEATFINFVKPWPHTLCPKTQKPKTKGPWADTKMLYILSMKEGSHKQTQRLRTS